MTKSKKKSKKEKTPTYKFDRRRAIECNLIGKSTIDGYWEYEILVGEKDGTTHTERAFGKDMSDALNKLLWGERVKQVEDFVSKRSQNMMIIAWVLGIVLPGIISTSMNTPIPVITIILINILCFIGWKLWANKYKKDHKRQ